MPYLQINCVNLDELLKEQQITVESLDTPCSVQDVPELAKYLPNWKLVSHYLDMTRYYHDIDSDCSTEEEKRLALLSRWREAFAHKATYKVLIEALLRHGYASSATSMLEYIKQKTASAMPETTGYDIPS